MMQTENKVHFKDFFSAHEAAQRRRAHLAEDGIAIRVEESPYGGYRIRMIPVATVLGSSHFAPARFFGRSGATKYQKD